ncbi:DUF3822 family protein [Rudanella lutea]|uniref:DUF3822 family protein n=1 Tax=Rudanella lutea TaxID=451374 RepID=UPI000486F93A|nr:DUF3822 family protein [Rudanella lutea]
MLTSTTVSPIVTVRQDTFDTAQTEQSVLCMEVSKDHFRFSYLDSQKRIAWLEDFAFPSLLTERSLADNLPAIFQDHSVLPAGPWQQVLVSVNSPAFTLIPKPLFRKEYASSYMTLMRGSALPPHEYAHFFEQPNENFVSVFNVEHRLANYLAGVYPLQNLTFVHQTTALITASAAVDRHLISTQNLLLYFEDEFATVILRSNRELRFCNRFGFKNPLDLTYYLLYVIEELRLEPYSVNVLLYGEITPFADTYLQLAEFLPHMVFGQTPAGIRFDGDNFDDLPEHRYLSLYGLSLLTA